uniref:Distal tail protein n=1 Tax=Myoviridae sp. ct2Pw37 TaxID=2825021 RepID=A0A8S5PBE4_9CAUD|nr:MAG TPA: distal tail protein [Myoviridae sp. ct2Pw37]
MIFKNINSEDIPGLIICSEPSISSSAIRTKETTIDGRDGTIVEKLGYKTRIKNVEIGLKKDANIDKILSYFSGEGDLIFKNENDKVYRAAIYEQVDLERLLRLRKGSVAFYCQPFKYKRNDIFEIIKDNKVKEKEGKYLELSKCAEQNILDLKLKGSTTQSTRSGKNKLPYNYYNGNSKTTNGITFTVNKDRSITANGTATANASFSITNPDNYAIAAGSYKLVGENNTYTKQAIRGSYKKADGTTTYIGSATSSFTIPEGATNVHIYVVIFQGETVNNVTFYPMILNSTETDLTFEAGGASPSPDYPSPIKNIEGKNKFNKSNMTEATWDNGKTNTVTLLEDGRIQSTANYAQWAAKCIDIPNLKANTDYVVSGKIISSTADNAMIIVKGYKNNTLSNIIYHRYAVGTRFELSFNSSDYEKIGISLSGDNNTLNTTYTTIFDEIQLEEGTAATDYVPYNLLEIKDIGENLYNKKDISGTRMAEVKINELTAGTYTLSALATSSDTDRTQCLVLDATNNKNLGYLNRNVRSSFTFTLEKPTKKLIFYASTTYNLGENDTFKFADIQIEQKTMATSYKPYQEQKVDFPLSEGQKLYEGSYLASDGIHHKRKQTTVTIQNIVALSNGNVVGIFQFNGKKYSNNNVLCCDKAKHDPNRRFVTDTVYENQGNVVFVGDLTDTLETLKAKYDGAILEYELAEEEIIPYIEAQQEAWEQLQNLKLYKGQNTMFSAEGTIIDLKYLEDTDEKVENQGNIYSKPIIRLEKTVFEEVEIAINGIRFKYNFGEDNYVEIDCEEMTALYEGLNRNRRLTIDFEFPKLEEGENDIIMYNGDCIIKCKRKDRWL